MNDSASCVLACATGLSFSYVPIFVRASLYHYCFHDDQLCDAEATIAQQHTPEGYRPTTVVALGNRLLMFALLLSLFTAKNAAS
jgi:hypothetical protein